MEPVPMTCEWLLQHPKYRSWRNKESSDLLWVSADPGCGKSALAKFLVGHIRQNKSERGIPELVCHFFFKDDSAAQRSSVLFLNALLYQVFKVDPSLLRHVFPRFESYAFATKFDFQILWSLLVAVSQDPGATNIIFVLDGLDECEPTSELEILEAIRAFFWKSNSSLSQRPYLKFIIFIRPENSIKPHLSHLGEIRLRSEDETEAISKDMELIIKHNMHEQGMQGLPDNLLAKFHKTLVEGADRTFLWTTLVIQLLKEASTDGVSENDLQKLLESRDLYVFCNYLTPKEWRSKDGS